MASLDFLHGVEVVEVDDGIRPIRTARFSVIGLVGSAGMGPINQPVLITSKREGVEVFGAWHGLGFTIPEALDAIYDQAGAWVVVVNVNDHAANTDDVVDESITFGTDGKAQVVNRFLTDVSLDTAIVGLQKFVDVADGTLTLPTGITAVTAVKSSDGVTTYVLDTDYSVTGNVITNLDAAIAQGATVRVEYTATLVADTDYSYSAESGIFTRPAVGSKIIKGATVLASYTFVDPSLVTEADIIGGVDPDTDDYTGVHAFKSAANALGVVPRILIAPRWTHQKTNSETANAVVAEMVGVADRLKAVIFADGPNTTDAAAYQYRQDWGSDRIMVVDPFVKVTDPTGATIQQPASARWAGVTSRVDQEVGFWKSPSNEIINGITGTARGIEFALGDSNARANLLNSQEVSTIIRTSGYRTWGNRSTTVDPKWAFLSVRRTADAIYESILQAHLWAVDRAINKNLVVSLNEGVNAYLRHLKAVGAILGGRAWADQALNTPEVIAAGQLYIDFEFTAPTPAERITFRAHLVNDYVTEIFDAAA